MRAMGLLASELFNDSVNDSKQKRVYREALLACTSLLSVLVLRKADSNSFDGQELYFGMISETFEQLEVLDSLLWQATLVSASAAANRLSRSIEKPKTNEGSRQQESEVAVLKSVLTLLNGFANVGHPKLLSLLTSNRLYQLVIANPLFADASHSWESTAANRRGYVPSPRQSKVATDGSLSSTSCYAGRDDPVHDIWLMSMEIIKASLRSSVQLKNVQITETVKVQFFGMSLDFLRNFREALFACLKDCGSVMHGSASSSLTLNALREATHILSVVSELCSRRNRDKFFRSDRYLYEEFVSLSCFVLMSISRFLAATGTSRELFTVLANYEALDCRAPQTPGSLKSRPTILSGDVPNARHEAIRYSHFASRCCACVTKSDFENSSIVPCHLKHLSQDRTHDPVLERNCRLSVTSQFVLQLEEIAAECIAEAVSIIWKTHPVMSSFVMFSEDEASQIDALPLVRPGMIIAIRNKQKRGIKAQGGPGEGAEILFGRVLRSDTVNRTWQVDVLQQTNSTSRSGESIVVSAFQLAGIEDFSRRRCVAAYRPAPDTAAELENMGRTLTLGHLILTLRWCHQHSLVMTGKLHESGLIQRITEQVSALLGAELSIHQEIGSPLNTPKADRARLDAQILELFDDDSSGEGRLKEIMSEIAWSAIQPQIARETERARSDMQEKENKRKDKPAAFDGSLYGGIRRSGYKSPFRG